MNNFNLSSVNEIKTVIRYTLIQYRENDNTLIRTTRQMAGEEIVFPEYATRVSTLVGTIAYKFFKRWKDASGIDAPTIVPEMNTTYYVENTIVTMPKNANVQATGSGEENQAMIEQFVIHAPFALYLKNTTYLSYVVKPSCTFSQSGSSIATIVSFKFQGLPYSPGDIKTYEPEFTLYKDSQCTEELGKVIIKITVHSSGQSSGD